MGKQYQRKKSRPLALQHSICERFIQAVLRLAPSLAAGARMLGYESPSTIYAIRSKKALPDLSKVHRLSQLKTTDGRQINIDWVITGRGSMHSQDGVAEIDENQSLEHEFVRVSDLSEDGRRILNQLISACRQQTLFRQ